jgi:hypothetical protein
MIKYKVISLLITYYNALLVIVLIRNIYLSFNNFPFWRFSLYPTYVPVELI